LAVKLTLCGPGGAGASRGIPFVQSASLTPSPLAEGTVYKGVSGVDDAEEGGVSGADDPADGIPEDPDVSGADDPPEGIIEPGDTTEDAAPSDPLGTPPVLELVQAAIPVSATPLTPIRHLYFHSLVPILFRLLSVFIGGGAAARASAPFLPIVI